MREQAYFVIDAESAGLYGPSFSVAGGVYINGKRVREFFFACPWEWVAFNSEDDKKWISENIPEYMANCDTPRDVRDEFWKEWQTCKAVYNCLMAVECGYPVETNFLAACVKDDEENRKWLAPYPLIEISSIMAAAGMDPMKNYIRNEDESPAHNPINDSRLSARLLTEALGRLGGLYNG